MTTPDPLDADSRSGLGRAAWALVGTVVAAVGVVAAVVVAVWVLVGGRPAVVEHDRAAGDDVGGGTSSVPLRAGVPDLPQDEVGRLEALQDRAPHAPPTSWSVPFSTWATPVDCDDAARVRAWAAVLDGLDTRGLRQECATADVVGERARGGGAEDVQLLYRFYLPEGVGLDDVGPADATDRGVSRTVVDLAGAARAVEPVDEPAGLSGGVTTVRWDGGLAAVQRWGPGRTALTWVAPSARWSEQGASSAATVHAVVATEPVLAVRAALGFVDQGGIRVVRDDDGTLLLVPASAPEVEMQALTGGVLTRTPQGCLGLDQGSSGFQLVLWPYGTTWDAGAQVLTVPVERGGSADYRLGDDMSLGGGEGEGRYAQELVPAGCASEKVWIGGSAAVR